MIPIRLIDDLPFVEAVITHQGKSIRLTKVLVDTGSAGTLVSFDRTAEIGFRGHPDDTFRQIFGVGGSESVLCSRIDQLIVGDMKVEGFEIELGGMDYGIELDAILGLDFLCAVGAVIDLKTLELRAI